MSDPAVPTTNPPAAPPAAPATPAPQPPDNSAELAKIREDLEKAQSTLKLLKDEGLLDDEGKPKGIKPSVALQEAEKERAKLEKKLADSQASIAALEAKQKLIEQKDAIRAHCKTLSEKGKDGKPMVLDSSLILGLLGDKVVPDVAKAVDEIIAAYPQVVNKGPDNGPQNAASPGTAPGAKTGYDAGAAAAEKVKGNVPLAERLKNLTGGK